MATPRLIQGANPAASAATAHAGPGYLGEQDARLADLIDVVSEKTELAGYPRASAVEQNVLIYDGARLQAEILG